MERGIDPARPDSPIAVAAIVPVKPFAESKIRLAPVQSPQARADLARRLFVQTLEVVSRAHGIARTAVVSRDAVALEIARERGAWTIEETPFGLNSGLEQATLLARRRGMDAALVIPTDLPRLQPQDLERMIALAAKPPCVVIAPAQRDGGTNALLVHPIGLIQYAFGNKSSIEHRRRGEQAGARVELYQSETIAVDLDLPEDARTLGFVMGADGNLESL